MTRTTQMQVCILNCNHEVWIKLKKESFSRQGNDMRDLKSKLPLYTPSQTLRPENIKILSNWNEEARQSVYINNSSCMYQSNPLQVWFFLFVFFARLFVILVKLHFHLNNCPSLRLPLQFHYSIGGYSG